MIFYPGIHIYTSLNLFINQYLQWRRDRGLTLAYHGVFNNYRPDYGFLSLDGSILTIVSKKFKMTTYIIDKMVYIIVIIKLIKTKTKSKQIGE